MVIHRCDFRERSSLGGLASTPSALNEAEAALTALRDSRSFLVCFDLTLDAKITQAKSIIATYFAHLEFNQPLEQPPAAEEKRVHTHESLVVKYLKILQSGENHSGFVRDLGLFFRYNRDYSTARIFIDDLIQGRTVFANLRLQLTGHESGLFVQKLENPELLPADVQILSNLFSKLKPANQMHLTKVQEDAFLALRAHQNSGGAPSRGGFF